jgi:hypothetical protein
MNMTDIQLYIDIFNANKSSFYRDIKAIRTEELIEDIITNKISFKKLQELRNQALVGFSKVYSDIGEIAFKYQFEDYELSELDRKGIYSAIADIVACEEVIADYKDIIKIKDTVKPNHLKLVVDNTSKFDKINNINSINQNRIKTDRDLYNNMLIQYDLD